jgi:hypothetical protein
LKTIFRVRKYIEIAHSAARKISKAKIIVNSRASANARFCSVCSKPKTIASSAKAIIESTVKSFDIFFLRRRLKQTKVTVV